MTRHRNRLVLAAPLVALLLTGLPVPGNAATTAAATRFELDLYRRGDYVAQTNLFQCVGASMQMMVNMIGSRDDRTAATQRRLWQLARTNSPPRPPDMPRRRGASVYGWAVGLNVLGVGPYRVVGFSTIQEATRAAAQALRTTGKPVGLLMWAGRHAWVMSGFRATADPLKSTGFRVTHVQVLDPLYPLGSSVWGRSPVPGTYLLLPKLAEDFVPRRRGRMPPLPGMPVLAGMYVIVMPVAPSADATVGLMSLARPPLAVRAAESGHMRVVA